MRPAHLRGTREATVFVMEDLMRAELLYAAEAGKTVFAKPTTGKEKLLHSIRNVLHSQLHQQCWYPGTRHIRSSHPHNRCQDHVLEPTTLLPFLYLLRLHPVPPLSTLINRPRRRIIQFRRHRQRFDEPRFLRWHNVLVQIPSKEVIKA